MGYYPIFLDIRNQHCLVIGGGTVGTRKAATLVNFGARVTVVDPNPSPALRKLAQTTNLRIIFRPYAESDMQNVLLVFAATDNERLNTRIREDAQRNGLLCNVAAPPDIGSFILPAVMQRGELTIAISTGGSSPALARRLRQQLEAQIGERYNRYLRLMGAIRKRLRAQGIAPDRHKHLIEQLLDSELLELLDNQRVDEIDRLLSRILGSGFRFEELMAPEER